MRINTPRRARRRAGVALELLLVFPILLSLLLAMVQFSMLLAARQQLAGASREAARVEALALGHSGPLADGGLAVAPAPT